MGPQTAEVEEDRLRQSTLGAPPNGALTVVGAGIAVWDAVVAFESVLSKDPKRFPKPDTAQADVLHAMLILIEKARDFIYIENQFFQSDFGQEKKFELGGPAFQVSDDVAFGAALTRMMPAMPIAPLKIPSAWPSRSASAERSSIGAGHPSTSSPCPSIQKGWLNDGPVMTQIHWTCSRLYSAHKVF